MILLAVILLGLSGNAFADEFRQNTEEAQRRSDIFITDYISALNSQAKSQDEKSPKAIKESLCPPNQVMNIDGSCSDADVTQNIFVYGSPVGEEKQFQERLFKKPTVPRPKIEYNVVVIKKDETKEDPIIIPPPKEKTIVLVLKEEKEKKRKVIKVPSHNSQPDVLFIDYKEGENMKLPFGFDLNQVLSSSSITAKVDELSNYGLEFGKKLNPWTSSPPFVEYAKTFGGSYGLPKVKKEISVDDRKNSSKELEALLDFDSLLKNHRTSSLNANVSNYINVTDNQNETLATSTEGKLYKPREILQPFVLEYSETEHMKNTKKNPESQNKTSGNQAEEENSKASKQPTEVDFSLPSLEQIQKTLGLTLKEYIKETSSSSSSESYNETQKPSSESNELQNSSVTLIPPLSSRELPIPRVKELPKNQNFYTQDLPLTYFKISRSGPKSTLQRGNKEVSKTYHNPFQDSKTFSIPKEKPKETTKLTRVYQRPKEQFNQRHSTKTKNIPNNLYQRLPKIPQTNILAFPPRYPNKSKTKPHSIYNPLKISNSFANRRSLHGIHSRKERIKTSKTKHPLLSSPEEDFSNTKIRLSTQLLENMKTSLLDNKVPPSSLLTSSYYKRKKDNSAAHSKITRRSDNDYNDNVIKSKYNDGDFRNENLSFIPSGRIIPLGSESHPVGWRRIDEKEKRTLGNPQRNAVKKADQTPLLRLPSFHYTKR